MKITLSPHHDRWVILLDEEKWREVHRSIFGKNPSFPSVVSKQELQTVFDQWEYRRVKSYVLWRLSVQSYHSEQLSKMLLDRLVQSKTINKVIQECKQMGFIDDPEWLKRFIQSHQKRYSLRLILSKLRAKGLSSEILNSIALEWQNPEEEQTAILHLLRTRYRSKDLSDFKQKQKVVSSLIRKGFSLDQIKIAIQQFLTKT